MTAAAVPETIRWTEGLDLPLGVAGRLGWPVVKPAFADGVRASLGKLAATVRDGITVKATVVTIADASASAPAVTPPSAGAHPARYWSRCSGCGTRASRADQGVRPTFHSRPKSGWYFSGRCVGRMARETKICRV